MAKTDLYWRFLESRQDLQEDFVAYLFKNIFPYSSPVGWYRVLTQGIKLDYEEFENQLGLDFLPYFCREYYNEEFREFLRDNIEKKLALRKVV